MKMLLTAALALAAVGSPTLPAGHYNPPPCKPPACTAYELNGDDHMPTPIQPDLSITSMRLVDRSHGVTTLQAQTRGGGFAIIRVFSDHAEVRVYRQR